MKLYRQKVVEIIKQKQEESVVVFCAASTLYKSVPRVASAQDYRDHTPL